MDLREKLRLISAGEGVYLNPEEADELLKLGARAEAAEVCLAMRRMVEIDGGIETHFHPECEGCAPVRDAWLKWNGASDD